MCVRTHDGCKYRCFYDSPPNFCLIILRLAAKIEQKKAKQYVKEPLRQSLTVKLFPRIKSAPFLRSIGAQAQAEVLKHQRRLQSSLDAVNR